MRSEPKSRLTESQNKDKKLFLKTFSSLLISYNVPSQQEFLKSLEELDRKVLIKDIHSQRQPPTGAPLK